MSMPPYSAHEEQIMRRHYPHWKAAEVARALGRSERSVHRKASAMGLRKTAAFYASWASGRLVAAQTDPRLIGKRFKPGHATWNKGRPGTTGLHPNCRPTQFKPGQKPHTWVPVGSYRINTHKSTPRLERKTSETPGPNHLRWEPVARLVWEEQHGPVPAGHIVVFDPPHAATTVLEHITVDKLACISRAENALRNSSWRRDPQVAKLIQLKGAINRQANRIHRESTERTSA